MIQLYTVEAEDEGKRIDIYLNELLDELSRSALQKLIKASLITVNDKSFNKSLKIKAGDVIRVEIPEAKEITVEPKNIPIEVLYEDEDVIVVNKEQGMVVHPAPGHYDDTLVNALLYRCKDSLSGINGELRPGIVHRIDKDTSGVLVIAKNDNAHRALSEQLSAHSMKRIYYAVVYNGFNEQEGTVSANIERAKNDRKKMAVVPVGGRRAVTHYTVLESLGKFTFIKLQLETGRTHQIRVHMSHIGHPLLGDTVYSSAKPPFDLQGQVLHAGILGFIHPRTGEYMEFSSPLPEYFEKVLDLLRNRI
ncbi:MAG TPA: RNA pseudouridine synthase [Lachnospiraceae bacterium]|nr:RNA pseudouridine synthase [Lachnospiraceae bacterium]